MDKTYTINCPECGIIINNQSVLYCDNCKNPIEKVKFGCFWYSAEELEDDNPFV